MVTIFFSKTLWNDYFQSLRIQMKYTWCVDVQDIFHVCDGQGIAMVTAFYGKILVEQTTTVEPLYNEVFGTMNITLLYQVSHYIRVKEQRNIKSWDQQNYLVIRGFCYIRPRYNEVPLYHNS